MRPLRQVDVALTRLIVTPVVLIVLLLMLSACARQAAQAASGSDGFQSLDDQPIEFTFPHKGGNLPLQVLVEANPAGSVRFSVYSDPQWRALRNGDVSAGVLGEGTADPKKPATLTWQGSEPEAGLYHVQVFRMAQPAAFRIAVSGPGSGGSLPSAFPTPVLPTPPVTDTVAQLDAVDLPAPVPPWPTTTRPKPSAGSAATAAALQAQRARPTVTPPAQPPPPSGSGAPRARIGTGNFNKLSDQAMEFDFYYPGGNQPVNVVVGAHPHGSVAFSVYTDRQWQLMASGDFSIPPIGKGTANPVEAGSLFWQSVSASPGLYHVRVYRLAEPAAFWIALSGPGAGDLISLSPQVPES